MQKSLQDLFSELDRTSVLSDSFKSTLRVMATHVASEAFERGTIAGRERAEANATAIPENALVVAQGQTWSSRYNGYWDVTVVSVAKANDGSYRVAYEHNDESYNSSIRFFLENFNLSA